MQMSVRRPEEKCENIGSENLTDHEVYMWMELFDYGWIPHLSTFRHMVLDM